MSVISYPVRGRIRLLAASVMGAEVVDDDMLLPPLARFIFFLTLAVVVVLVVLIRIGAVYGTGVRRIPYVCCPPGLFSAANTIGIPAWERESIYLNHKLSKPKQIPKIRILVVGDSGVGKSSLIYKLCNQGNVLKQPRWTVGCAVEVMAYEYKRTFFIEFFDIGFVSLRFPFLFCFSHPCSCPLGPQRCCTVFRSLVSVAVLLVAPSPIELTFFFCFCCCCGFRDFPHNTPFLLLSSRRRLPFFLRFPILHTVDIANISRVVTCFILS